MFLRRSFPLLLAVLGCTTPGTPDRLATLYVDLLRFRDTVSRPDSAEIRRGVDSILVAAGYTVETYQREFTSLAEDPRRLPVFFDLVEQRLAATNPAARQTH